MRADDSTPTEDASRPEPDPDLPGPAGDIESFRGDLRVIAGKLVGNGGANRSLIDPSDIVQQTLLLAHEHRQDCRGTTRAEWKAWLRTILTRQIAEAARRLHRRPEGHPVSLDRAIDQSSLRLERWLASNVPTASSMFGRQELTNHLIDALGRLPDDQRLVVMLHYFDDISVPDVSALMGRTRPAVAGLLRRGLQHLRVLLGDVTGDPAS